jgi:hypothetical protein
VAGCYEHANEPALKDGEMTNLGTVQSKSGFCFMELVSQPASQFASQMVSQCSISLLLEIADDDVSRQTFSWSRFRDGDLEYDLDNLH